MASPPVMTTPPSGGIMSTGALSKDVLSTCGSGSAGIRIDASLPLRITPSWGGIPSGVGPTDGAFSMAATGADTPSSATMTPSWSGTPSGMGPAGGAFSMAAAGADTPSSATMTPSWNRIPSGTGLSDRALSIETVGAAAPPSATMTPSWGGVPAGTVLSVWTDVPPVWTSLLMWASDAVSAAVAAV